MWVPHVSLLRHGFTRLHDAHGTGSQSFTYDQLNRVQSAQAGTSWGDTYVYDPWGNLLQKSPMSGVGAAENLVITVNPTNQVVGLAYDAAGDVTSDNLGNNWSYDAEGRVSTVAGYTYTYDGDGNRVIKSGTNSRMYWTDPGGTVLSETDLSGNNTVRDVYLGNKLIARKDASGSIHYLVQDQLGSERVSVSASGAVEDDMDTYPWGGDATTSTATSGNLYTFTGDEKDTESTSFHTPFRQLSSTMGRWLRPDPYDGSYDATNPQSLNRYGYVLNSPLSLIDPSGLCVISNTTDTQGNIISTSYAQGGHYGAPCTQPPNGCVWQTNASGDKWTGMTCDSNRSFPVYQGPSGNPGTNNGGGGGGSPAPNNKPGTPQTKQQACSAAKANLAALYNQDKAMSKTMYREMGAGAGLGCVIGVVGTETVAPVVGTPLAVGDCAVGAIGGG